MTKPTITDEDRALAEFLIGGTFTEADADEIAAYRQAAFNAGLERAAVIAWQFTNDKELTAAIRAEKEKPQ